MIFQHIDEIAGKSEIREQRRYDLHRIRVKSIDIGWSSDDLLDASSARVQPAYRKATKYFPGRMHEVKV